MRQHEGDKNIFFFKNTSFLKKYDITEIEKKEKGSVTATLSFLFTTVVLGSSLNYCFPIYFIAVILRTCTTAVAYCTAISVNLTQCASADERTPNRPDGFFFLLKY